MDSAYELVYKVMKHLKIRLYIAIFQTLASVGHIALSVFTIKVDILRRLQCKDTKLSQCNFTIHLSKQTNCI
jgi:hypothetical protein